MVTTWPSVGVVVPTRGRPDSLRRAVTSVFDQWYPGSIEVVVVFDQQAPAPLDVVPRPGRLLRTTSNTRAPGPAGARNTGVLALDTDLVAFLDDDDAWTPDKLGVQVELLRAHPGAVVAACGVLFEGPRRRHVRQPPAGRIDADLLQRGRHVALHTSTLVAWRQRSIDAIGHFDETIPSGYGEDLDWLLRAAAVSPLVSTPSVLVHVAFTGASWFQGRWPVVAEALQFQLARRPELSADPGNLARIQGRIAFAYAASAQPGAAREWAARCRRTSWREPRSYLATAVRRGLLSPAVVVRVAGWVGRGV